MAEKSEVPSDENGDDDYGYDVASDSSSDNMQAILKKERSSKIIEHNGKDFNK